METLNTCAIQRELDLGGLLAHILPRLLLCELTKPMCADAMRPRPECCGLTMQGIATSGEITTCTATSCT